MPFLLWLLLLFLVLLLLPFLLLLFLLLLLLLLPFPMTYCLRPMTFCRYCSIYDSPAANTALI
ncbi:MAG: hypothetical protein EHM48_04965 [Planctomycetaceae bacterium]|nr:MAG: hypothetical protein EHM48_04965 [Planctomycetaceae bacterium]